MNVKWSYEGLTCQHTADETDDTTAHVERPITPTELILHAANLHLLRIAPVTQDGLELWSSKVSPPFK